MQFSTSSQGNLMPFSRHSLFREGQRRIRQLLTTDCSIGDILTSLVCTVEEQAPGALCSVLLLDDTGRYLHTGSAPNLPKEYSDAIEGVEIGPSKGSCGTAAYRGERVIVEDIETDPLWAEAKHLGLSHGLRACWSQPIFSSVEQVLGTFAVYYNTARRPTEQEIELLETAAELAGIAIEWKRTEDALKGSQERLSRIIEGAHDGIWEWDFQNDSAWWNECLTRMIGREVSEKSLQAFIEFIHPDDRDILPATLERHLHHGEKYEAEFRFVRPDGEIRYVLSRGKAVLDSSGVAIRLSGTLTDITERKKAQLALKNAEEEYRALFLNARDAFLIVDDDGRYLRVNPAACKKLGLPEEDIVGRRISDLFFPEDETAFAETWANFLAEGQMSGDIPYTMPDGTARVFSFNAVVNYMPGKHLSVVRDVTQARDAEAALKTERDYTSQLIQSAPFLVCGLSPDGATLFINQAVTDATGYQAEELVGRNWWQVFYPGRSYRQVERLFREFENGNVNDYEMTMTVKDGTKRVVAWTSLNKRDGEGNITEVVGFGNDTTELREMHNRILDSYQELEQKVWERTKELRLANEALRENEKQRHHFVEALTHDLKTPLVAQQHLLDALDKLSEQSECQNPDTKLIFDGLLKNNAALLNMVNKLLESYEFIDGEVELNKESFCFEALVQECFRDIGTIAQSKNIVLAYQTDGNVVALCGDRAYLKRVLINLLGNALENIPEGKEIHVMLSCNEGTLRISVRDNGPGMPPELVENLFNRYFVRTKTRKIGSGLGLFICKEIMQLHGGSIRVDSTLGQGTEFTLELPAEP